MARFDFLQKKAKWNEGSYQPYSDGSIDLIYNLLFCDYIELLKENTPQPYAYPADILFSEPYSPEGIQNIIDDDRMDVRFRVFAYNKQLANGKKPANKELLAVIVEIGQKQGLDVLASFKDGTARYINYTGKLLVWEATDETSLAITNRLFEEGRQVIEQLGPWDKARRPCPATGDMRITFLVSDGLYFGEGPVNVMFKEPLAMPTLNAASQLMSYLVEQSLKKQ